MDDLLAFQFLAWPPYFSRCFVFTLNVPKITSFSGVFLKYKAIKIMFAQIISFEYIIFIIIIRMTCLGHFIICSQILYFRLSYILVLLLLLFLLLLLLLLLYQLWTNVIHFRFRKISNTIWQHVLIIYQLFKIRTGYRNNSSIVIGADKRIVGGCLRFCYRQNSKPLILWSSTYNNYS